MIEACKRYGDQEGCLWEQALGYFARKEEDCKAYISEVLHHIDQNNLMPPLLGERLRAAGHCFLLNFHQYDYMTAVSSVPPSEGCFDSIG